MGDQLQPVQPIQKWYTKPQVLVPAAAAGYLLLNKKTRKPVLTAGGAYLLFIGMRGITSNDGFSQGFGRLFAGAGGLLLWLGLRKK